MTTWRKLLLCLLLSAFCFAQDAPSRRPIKETDLFDFVWVANPQVSPDGSRVAFTRVVVDAKKTNYETSLWMVSTTPGSIPERLTNGKHDGSPRWSPDGRQIAFVRGFDRGEDGKPKPPQLALLSLAGGEAQVLTDLPKGAGNPVWSPDGHQIAFLSSTSPEDLDKAKKKPSPDDHESDVHLVTRAVYRSNGQGYLDFTHHAHIWVTKLPSAADEIPKPLQLTLGDYDEESPVWARDGSKIYFLTERVAEPYYGNPKTDLYSVSADGKQTEKLTTIPMGLGSFALSPDGKQFAFHASAETDPVRSYSQPDLWVMDNAADAKPRNLTANVDFDMGSGVGGDNAPPRGGSGRGLSWSADGKSLLDTEAKIGTAYLVRVDVASGKVTEITRREEAVLDFSVSRDGQRIVALVSTPTMICDLFTVSAEGQEARLTDVNAKLWSQLNITAPEEINYKSFDGKTIQGWIQKPPDFDPGKKYPLILNIHGGPHSAYGWIFDHEFQWMAARGYIVFYPNPRGSTSYGQDFGNIIQWHYPGDDFKDLMAGVDELLKRGYIDEKRLGVTGGSGGGVLTDWTVTHTNRFAAAVSQRDISNWTSWWYTADFTLFQPSWFKGPPFREKQDFESRSAITYVENIHTPILFVLGEADSRTPPDSGGEQLFRALKFLHRPTAMVFFPRESHELSRSGEPWHRIERLHHIVYWFDKWMLGANHPEYDMPTDQVEKPKEMPPADKPADPKPQPGTAPPAAPNKAQPNRLGLTLCNLRSQLSTLRSQVSGLRSRVSAFALPNV